MSKGADNKASWAPNILRPWTCDRLNVALLEASVKSGGFVPFLGAGASSLRPRYKEEREGTGERLREEPWTSVCRELASLLAALKEEALKEEALKEGEAKEKGDSKEYSFLESFAKEHRCECAVAESPEPVCDKAIFNLQLALVRLAARLTTLFGQRVAEGYTCVLNPQEFTASVHLGSSGSEQVVNALVDCLLAAHALRREKRPLFYSENIWRKLVHFSYEHTDDATWISICNQVRSSAPEADPEETVKKLRDRQFRFSERGNRLALSEIAWITQLLWYSLTFQVKSYPTTSELAFRLSLFSQNVPPRIGELAQAAETVADYRELVDEVGELFEYYNSNMKAPFGSLHRAIRDALLFAFERREEERVRRELPPPIPMALTTNFDMALENTFEEAEETYHVVFPVFGSDRSGALSQQSTIGTSVKFPRILWVVKTIDFSSGDRSVDWVVWNRRRSESEPEGESEGEEDCSFDGKGPVIVKLHGSPVEVLPRERLRHRYQGLCHCIVLPESTYLEMMLQQDSTFPEWIVDALKTPRNQQVDRSLWFLGYSVSDWNVRLRLYQQLRWTVEGKEGEAPDLVAVNWEFDRYQSAVFGRLKVNGREGDLQSVASAISDLMRERRL